jgi:hypothetical protein
MSVMPCGSTVRITALSSKVKKKKLKLACGGKDSSQVGCGPHGTEP